MTTLPKNVRYARRSPRVSKAANALTDLGLAAGDRVAICVPMVPEAKLVITTDGQCRRGKAVSLKEFRWTRRWMVSRRLSMCSWFGEPACPITTPVSQVLSYFAVVRDPPQSQELDDPARTGLGDSLQELEIAPSNDGGRQDLDVELSDHRHGMLHHEQFGEFVGGHARAVRNTSGRGRRSSTPNGLSGRAHPLFGPSHAPQPRRCWGAIQPPE